MSVWMRTGQSNHSKHNKAREQDVRNLCKYRVLISPVVLVKIDKDIEVGIPVKKTTGQFNQDMITQQKMMDVCFMA